MNRAYHFETFILALFINATAGAEGIKPQVTGDADNTAAKSATLPSASEAGVPAQVSPVGQPIVYPVNNRDSHLPSVQSNDESNALLNAFGMFLSGLGGGSASNNLFGRDSEIVDSGDDGGSYTGMTGLTPVSPTELTGMRKIIPPFQKWFGACTKGLGLGICRFENMGIMGDASHRKRRSCHNSGQAIDVGTVTCSGGQKITPSSAKYFDLANCMANDSNNELQVIFYKASGPNMIKKSDHNNHMHVQLKSCAMVYGQ